ncbi:hypothetical protein VTJ04DRAFT_1704 [Mycothermus thermophilus]|uniref:uncharacterized protein n=1 Tax=Humicola insolens TaxID=85995 RepID=UPI0037429366
MKHRRRIGFFHFQGSATGLPDAILWYLLGPASKFPSSAAAAAAESRLLVSFNLSHSCPKASRGSAPRPLHSPPTTRSPVRVLSPAAPDSHFSLSSLPIFLSLVIRNPSLVRSLPQFLPKLNPTIAAHSHTFRAAATASSQFRSSNIITQTGQFALIESEAEC